MFFILMFQDPICYGAKTIKERERNRKRGGRMIEIKKKAKKM